MEPGMSAVCLEGETCHREVDPVEAARLTRAATRPVWLHLVVRAKAAAADLLSTEFDFHDLAVEDALSPNERPSLSDFDDYLFLGAPAIAERNGKSEDYVEVGSFLRKTALVSVVEKPCPILDAWV